MRSQPVPVLCGLLLLPSLLLAFSSPAAAQDQPAKFILMVTMTIKPEAVSEYEDHVKKIQAAAAKIGAPRALVYQRGDTYNFFVPFNKGDEIAVWPNELLRPDFEIVKAYGEAEARHIEQSSFHGITKREFRILTYRPDLSTGAAPSSK